MSQPRACASADRCHLAKVSPYLVGCERKRGLGVSGRGGFTPGAAPELLKIPAQSAIYIPEVMMFPGERVPT